MKPRQQLMPKARKNGILTQDLSDGLLIYDLTEDCALSLNKTAKCILEVCNGKTPIEEAIVLINRKLKSKVTKECVWAGIKLLAKNNLLDPSTLPSDMPKIDRRSLIRSFGSLAIALPLITTVVAPTTASAQSSSVCVNLGSPCCTTLDCCGFQSGAVCLGPQCQPGQPAQGAICCASNMGGRPPGDVFNGLVPDASCNSLAVTCCSANISVNPGTSCQPSPGGGFQCQCICGPFA